MNQSLSIQKAAVEVPVSSKSSRKCGSVRNYQGPGPISGIVPSKKKHIFFLTIKLKELMRYKPVGW